MIDPTSVSTHLHRAAQGYINLRTVPLAYMDQHSPALACTRSHGSALVRMGQHSPASTCIDQHKGLHQEHSAASASTRLHWPAQGCIENI